MLSVPIALLFFMQLLVCIIILFSLFRSTQSAPSGKNDALSQLSGTAGTKVTSAFNNHDYSQIGAIISHPLNPMVFEASPPVMQNTAPNYVAQIGDSSVSDSSASSMGEGNNHRFLPFQMNLDLVDNINEVADLHQQFQEFYSLMKSNDPLSWRHALEKALEFDNNSKKVILKYAFTEEHWYLTRLMLEKGFDASEILIALNNLQPDVALEKVNKIGCFGIYKDKDGFKYKDINVHDGISRNLVQYYKFRLLRSISPDLEAARESFDPEFSKLISTIALSNNQRSNLYKLSKLDRKQKSLALACMVAIRKWDVAKDMIARGYDQKLLKRLLNQCSDDIAINSYKMLGFYPDFDIDNIESYWNLDNSVSEYGAEVAGSFL